MVFEDIEGWVRGFMKFLRWKVLDGEMVGQMKWSGM